MPPPTKPEDSPGATGDPPPPTGPQAAAPQSVDRIFSVLDALASPVDGMRLSELARVVATPKSSLAGLLVGMVDGGYLLRGDSGLYRLGPRMFSLATRVVGNMNLSVLARPTLEWLVAQTGETVLLGTLAPSGDRAMYIDKVESPSELRYTVPLGERRELYSTSIGKLLLAHMPPSQQRNYLKKTPLRAFTPSTITSVAVLRKELAAIREEGVSRTRGDRVAGASALSAPVFSFQQELVAGLVVAGPSERMEEREAQHVASLLEAAARLTRALAGKAP
jgi:DNA-binding IclR family transcriptional regulator